MSGEPAASSQEDVDLSDKLLDWTKRRRTIELTLYGSVTIVAVILGVSVDSGIRTPGGLIAAMWATSIGLIVAHGFAVAVSSRVVSPNPLPFGSYIGSVVDGLPLLLSSIVATMGALIAGLFDPSLRAAGWGADIALVVFCSAIAWAGGTVYRVPIGRRLALATFVAVFMTFIALIKVVLHP
jgi:hypothetical protein